MHFCQNVPFVLVGCKSDLRSDKHTLEELSKQASLPVSTEQGQHIAEKIGAFAYLECSAKSGEGVKQVFEVATRAAMKAVESERKKENRCLIL